MFGGEICIGGLVKWIVLYSVIAFWCGIVIMLLGGFFEKVEVNCISPIGVVFIFMISPIMIIVIVSALIIDMMLSIIRLVRAQF